MSPCRLSGALVEIFAASLSNQSRVTRDKNEVVLEDGIFHVNGELDNDLGVRHITTSNRQTCIFYSQESEVFDACHGTIIKPRFNGNNKVILVDKDDYLKFRIGRLKLIINHEERNTG